MYKCVFVNTQAPFRACDACKGSLPVKSSKITPAPPLHYFSTSASGSSVETFLKVRGHYVLVWETRASSRADHGDTDVGARELRLRSPGPRAGAERPSVRLQRWPFGRAGGEGRGHTRLLFISHPLLKVALQLSQIIIFYLPIYLAFRRRVLPDFRIKSCPVTACTRTRTRTSIVGAPWVIRGSVWDIGRLCRFRRGKNPIELLNKSKIPEFIKNLQMY